MAEYVAQTKTLYAQTHLRASDGEVLVRLVPPKPAALIGFLSVWFVGWTFGGISALSGMLRSGLGVMTLFLLVWLAGWLVGETLVGAILAYLVAGEHVLSFTRDGLDRKQHAFGLGLAWHYAAGDISGVRATTVGDRGHERTALVLDYRGSPVTVHLDVPAAEAERIAAAVLGAFPEYR